MFYSIFSCLFKAYIISLRTDIFSLRNIFRDIRVQSNNTWHFFDLTPPRPPLRCDIKLFILKNTSTQNRKLLFKKGPKMSHDTLVDPLHPPCVIWWHCRESLPHSLWSVTYYLNGFCKTEAVDIFLNSRNSRKQMALFLLWKSSADPSLKINLFFATK